LAADFFERFSQYDPSVSDFVKLGSRSDLEVLSFGVREENAPRPSEYFVRSKLLSDGNGQQYVTKKKWRELVDEDVEVDILEYEKRDWEKHALPGEVW